MMKIIEKEIKIFESEAPEFTGEFFEDVSEQFQAGVYVNFDCHIKTSKPD